MIAGEWSTPGLLAAGPLDRLLGRRRAGAGEAVVLATRSVHSLFEREPLQVVVVDAGMRVSRIRVLAPRRIMLDLGARYLIELPPGEAPEPGSMVELADA